MSDNYSQRKTQVIREFLDAEFQAPYIVETVLPLRDPLADTKFKIILNNQVERTLSVCPAVVLDSLPHSRPIEAATCVEEDHGQDQVSGRVTNLPRGLGNRRTILRATDAVGAWNLNRPFSIY